MTAPIHILGIAGSLRQSSYNHAALVAAQTLLPEGVSLDIFALQGIPLFNQDEEEQPVERVLAFKKAILEADAILFATPEYNYSLPGVLKNAMDCASRPYGQSAWAGKPVALMGASVGQMGSARAQYHLRQVLVSLDMRPLNQPEVMIGLAANAFDAHGHLTDERSRVLIRQLIENLVRWVRQLTK